MIFDKFCAIVERHLPSFERIARETKVFLFDQPAHAIKPGDSKPEDFENFTLPFPCVVMEDPATAVLLLDTEENQVGMFGMRRFVDIVPAFGDDSMFKNKEIEVSDAERKEMEAALREKGWDDSTLIMTFGDISMGTPQEKRIELLGGASRLMIASKSKVFVEQPLTSADSADFLTSNATMTGAKNAIAAIEELISIYTHKHFVLETAPVNPKLHPKKIPRVHQRPSYTILDARTIRKKMGTLEQHEQLLEEGRTRNSPIPHERRRHPRKLTVASGYKEDKTIIIPAMWIGQSEAKVGNKVYKVRLDI